MLISSVYFNRLFKEAQPRCGGVPQAALLSQTLFQSPGLSMQVQQAMNRKDLGGRTKTKSFARSIIQEGDNTVNVLLRNGVKVKLFREILAKKPIRILIGASLP